MFEDDDITFWHETNILLAIASMIMLSTIVMLWCL
jgi:hypothetical protein